MQINAKAFLEGLFAGDADIHPAIPTPSTPSMTEPAESYARRASALLATIADDERRADLRFEFEERIAICEVDGGSAAEQAERVAFEHLQRALEGGTR